MKKRILASILMLFMSFGIQVTAEAKVLIKNGVPQTDEVSFDTYKSDGWGAYPDYHVQNASPSIWESQLGGINSNVNCVPATTKMLLNMKGLMKEKSVDALGNEGLREVNNYTMLNYLQPYGYLGKFIMGGPDVIKQYLDWGNVVAVPTVVHERLCVGYATRNGSTWFEVLDPAFKNISEGHLWIEEKMIGVGFAITDTNKVRAFTVDYTGNDGSSKYAIAYYNNIDYYFPKSMINEMLPQTLSKENYFKTLVLPTMNYEGRAEDTITNIDKISNEYMYIGNTIYQKYEFTSNSELQKENNTILKKSINETQNAA